MEGFAGSHLAEYLLSQGHCVGGTVFRREAIHNIRSILQKVTVFECDLREKGSISSAIQQFEPEGIFHLAGQPFVPQSFQDPIETFHTNVMVGVNLLDAMRRFSLSTRVMIISTAGVYGAIKPADIPIDEETSVRPMNPYSTSKLCLEQVTLSFIRDFDVSAILLRPFNHTGPRQNPDFVCADFSRQVARIEKGLKPPIMTVGNLFPVRDFTDVRDMVKGYYQAFEKGEVGEVYNLCSSRGVTIRKVLETLLEHSSKEIKIVEESRRKRSAEIPEVIGDFSKFHKLTGWKPEIPLSHTLSDMFESWSEEIDSTS
jgi:GDP-4-dehydro-6-deoxy-D-mannose reductase